jgi:hypothetical protein
MKHSNHDNAPKQGTTSDQQKKNSTQQPGKNENIDKHGQSGRDIGAKQGNDSAGVQKEKQEHRK